MLAELLALANTTPLADGECLEVHCGDDWSEPSVVGVYPISRFLETWDYALELHHRPSSHRRYLRVVHEGGALLVPLGK